MNIDIINSILISYPYLLGLVSFGIGAFLMPYVIQMAQKKELIVKPNRRTAHEGGVPNIGGINIFSSFILAFLLFLPTEVVFQHQVILVGMYFILLVGFFDDMIEISPVKKLCGEIIAGVLLIVVADVRLTSLYGFFGFWEIPVWISYIMSFLAYLLIINGLNLVDGVDGLASGLGILICTFFGLYFDFFRGEYYLSMMSFALAGALLIFFIYNVFGDKSKIFMGDSGSLVLGYIVYLFIVRFCDMNVPVAHDPEEFVYVMQAAPVVAMCVLAIPLIDTIRVMIMRIIKKRSPFVADKNHVHHQLLSIGLKHKEVTFILLFINVFFISMGLLFRNFKAENALAIIIVCAIALVIFLKKIVDRFKKD